MVDIENERLIPIGKAPEHLPGRPAYTTVWRWALKGVRGRKLETVAIGGRRYTSHEAIERFAVHEHAAVAMPPSQYSKQRLKQIEAAERKLKEMGV